MSNFTAGDVSGSQTLTDDDHLYPSHINELRQSRAATAVVGRDPNSEYYCDGVDDDVQIQSAIDAVADAGGGIVFIKEGTYTLRNDNVTPAGRGGGAAPYYGILLKSKVALIGAGIGKTIFTISGFVSGTGGRYTMIINGTASGDEYLTISGISLILPDFQGGSGAYWGTGIYFEGSKYNTITDVYIKNAGFRLDGNTVSFDTSNKELTTDCYGNFISNVIVDGCLGSSAFFSVKDTIVSHCQFYDCYDDSFLVAAASQNVKFDNCIYDNKFNANNTGSASGLIYIVNDDSVTTDIYAISDIQINNCTFRNSTIGDGVRINKAKNVVINGGEASKCKRGVYVEGVVHNVIIQGMNVWGNTGSAGIGGIGIQCNTSSHEARRIDISNNIVYNNVGYGISVNNSGSPSMDQILVHDNLLYDDQSTPTQNPGIYIAGLNSGIVLSNISVKHNNIDATITTPIQISPGSGGRITGVIRENIGFVTENTGTGSIASGTTSTTITHGLAVTPRAEDITITLTNDPTNTPGAVWVDNITSTQFNVNCENDPGASGLNFSWQVKYLKDTWT